MRRAAILVLLAAGLAGCGAVPFDYHSQNDIPRGPGMFSGADGAFVFRTKDSEEWREFQEWKRRKAAEERR